MCLTLSDVRHAGAGDARPASFGGANPLADPLLIRPWLQWKNLKERFMWAA